MVFYLLIGNNANFLSFKSVNSHNVVASSNEFVMVFVILNSVVLYHVCLILFQGWKSEKG